MDQKFTLSNQCVCMTLIYREFLYQYHAGISMLNSKIIVFEVQELRSRIVCFWYLHPLA